MSCDLRDRERANDFAFGGRQRKKKKKNYVKFFPFGKI